MTDKEIIEVAEEWLGEKLMNEAHVYVYEAWGDPTDDSYSIEDITIIEPSAITERDAEFVKVTVGATIKISRPDESAEELKSTFHFDYTYDLKVRLNDGTVQLEG